MELATLSVDQLRWLCDQSFWFFAKLIGGAGWVPKPDGSQPFTHLCCEAIHKPLCDFIQTEKRCGICMPRDWRKTLIFTKLYTIWCYLQDHECCQLIVSERADSATKMLHGIKGQLLKNKLMRKLYPELEQVNYSWTKTHRWSGNMIDLPKQRDDASIEVIGVGGAAQGGHYDRIHIDDLIGKKAMESPVVLVTTLLWLDNVNELTAVPNLDAQNASQITYIGTHWQVGDAIQYLEKERKEFKWKKVSCLKDDRLDPTIWVNNPGVEVGESNFPVFPTSHYIDMQSNPSTSLVYWTQHANNPGGASGLTKFDIKWLKYYRWDTRGDDRVIVCEDDGEVIPFSLFPVYGFIDPGGFAENKMKGARNAILVGGQPAGSHKKFVTWCWAGRPKKTGDFLDQVFLAYKDQKPRNFRCESIAAQDYILRDIKQACDTRGIKFPVLPLEHDVNKNVKDADIVALINPMSNGEIYVHRTMKDLIAEVAAHPGGITVDCLDMLAKLNRYVFKRGVRQDMTYVNDKHAWIQDHRSQRTGY